MSATRRQCVRRPAGVRCPVGQDHVTLALASLAIGLGAMVADEPPLRRPAAAGGHPGGVAAHRGVIDARSRAQ